MQLKNSVKSSIELMIKQNKVRQDNKTEENNITLKTSHKQ